MNTAPVNETADFFLTNATLHIKLFLQSSGWNRTM